MSSPGYDLIRCRKCEGGVVLLNGCVDLGELGQGDLAAAIACYCCISLCCIESIIISAHRNIGRKVRSIAVLEKIIDPFSGANDYTIVIKDLSSITGNECSSSKAVLSMSSNDHIGGEERRMATVVHLGREVKKGEGG